MQVLNAFRRVHEVRAAVGWGLAAILVAVLFAREQLSAVRDLATGDGARYGYADGLLTLEIPSEGEGRRHDHAVRVVAPGDAEALADAILHLAADPELRRLWADPEVQRRLAEIRAGQAAPPSN